jgi:predicted MFS family arabinose efflux permease
MAIAFYETGYNPADHRPVPRRYAWSVFAILFGLMIVDYIDRQVVVSMFPHLKAQWDLSDAQLGGLVSVVAAAVGLATVPLSLLADRWSRVKSIFLMALVWSLATIACAYASSYGELLGLRSVVGLGEAAYGAAGGALLATIFPTRMRSTVLGAFLASGIFGSVGGVVLGGFISEHWGWQAGFGAVGIPGLLLAFLFLLIVRDYKTVALPSRSGASTQKLTATAIVGELLRSRTAIVTCLAHALLFVMVSATWVWLPSYFSRYYGLGSDQAGLKTGLVVLMGGIGAIVWSAVADRLSARLRIARLLVPATASAITALLMWIAFLALPPGNAQFALIIAGGTIMTASLGPSAAVVVDVVHPALRATVASALALTQNLFGLAAGPLLMGFISDAYGLPFALSVAPVFCVFAAVGFVIAARTYPADLKKVVEPRSEDGLQLAAA